MPRRLPWLALTDTREAQKKPPSRKRKALQVNDDDDDDSGTDLTIPSSQRTPSLSPQPPALPSSPVLPPYEELRPGFDADDAWVMVEDEFLSTAHLFTVKLHQEEYLRRKELADQDRNSDLRERDFGTDHGRTQQSGQTKAKIRGEASRKEVKKALKNVFGGAADDEKHDGYNQDPMLSELMAPNNDVNKVLKRVLTPKKLTMDGRQRADLGQDSFDTRSDRSASPSDLDASVTDLGSSPRVTFRESSPPQRLTGLKHSIILKSASSQSDSVLDPPSSPPMSLVKAREPATENIPSSLVLNSPPAFPLKTQKRGAKNPKIQQLLARAKLKANRELAVPSTD
jgi:hypothetical protein